MQHEKLFWLMANKFIAQIGFPLKIFRLILNDKLLMKFNDIFYQILYAPAWRTKFGAQKKF